MASVQPNPARTTSEAQPVDRTRPRRGDAERITRISTRLGLVLAAAALVPLVTFGIWAFLSLQAETRRSVIDANLTLVNREAGDLARELSRDTDIVAALADDVLNTNGNDEARLRVLDNYMMRFPSFRGLTVLNEHGGAVASRGTAPPIRLQGSLVGDTGITLSPVSADRDDVPTAQFAARLQGPNGPVGWIVTDVAFQGLWELVDNLRVGEHGLATMLDVDGRVIATGASRSRATLPRGANLAAHPLFGSRRPSWREYVDARGEQQLAVAAEVTPTGWLLLLEQPAREAFAPTRRLGFQLTVAAAVAALCMLVLGTVLGRRALAPVHALERATQAVSAGDFTARVDVRGTDEFARLGHSFNEMADRLVALQTEMKRQERQVIFGRVVAGLLHDLNQPVQSIANGARLLLRPDLDEVSRSAMRRTLDHELETLRRFMDDLLNVARPKPLDRVAVDVQATVLDAVEALRGDAVRAQIALTGDCAAGLPRIDADRFALGRVFRNLIANAVQATPPGGRIVVTASASGDAVDMAVIDTGSGIPPGRLPTLFDDFATTRRRGLGLGLATSRRLVEQMGGTITVTSQLGEGTTFTLRFPAARSRAVEAAS